MAKKFVVWDDITKELGSAGNISRSRVRDLFSSPFWDNIPDKPSVYPPELHASTHAKGGSDELSLDATQITSGVLSADRIPELDASKITSGLLDVARLPKNDLYIWYGLAGPDALAQDIENGVIDVDTAASLLNMYVDLASKIDLGLIDKYKGVERAVSVLGSTNISATTAHNILASAYLTADYVQTILYRMIELGYISKVIEILTATAADGSITADTTITGTNRYKNLIIDTGITLIVDGQPGVIIAETITNNGTILKTATGGPGGTTPTAPGAGGTGGGGLIIIAKSYAGGVVSADGEAGEAGKTTAAASGIGGAGGDGSMVVVGTDSPGNGGNGGSALAGNGGDGGTPGGGGGGGSNSSSGAGGNGGNITLTTKSSYSEVFEEILKAVIDWYIVNVLGKSPTSTMSLYNCYGAGGGGGGENNNYADCGGGGGSGGHILMCVVSINGGIFTAVGGAGGNGGIEGNFDAGAGGGGGGIVYILYKTLVASPTIDVSGGARGTGDYNGAAGTAGTGVAVQV